MDYVY
jgi:serum/glucocorticoid-regulated kinase 2